MRRELLLLREMRDAAEQVRELVGERRPVEIDADPMRRAALLWHFTVLGEAASRIPAETKEAHPAIAWTGATRLRNRIVHGYWDIDVETLVSTAADDIPQMIISIEEAIASLDGEDQSVNSAD